MAHLLRSQSAITPTHQGGIVTIGNFDGVHKGHQALLAQLTQEAKARGVPSTVVTFEPHPVEFFAGHALKVARLTRLREKITALRACGVDQVLVLRFNADLAKLSPDQFIQKVIVRYLKPNKMIVGDDFRFGYKREGDIETLTALGKQHDFAVEAMPTFILQDERVSSTRLRAALAVDDQALVRSLLGRAYTMQGRVQHGNQLGRTLGFPTANIALHRRLSPIRGIYVVYMNGMAGVASLGTRPAVKGTTMLLEVHLLDFAGDIYGQPVTVEFCKKLRDERDFAHLAALKAQIAQDVRDARDYFERTLS